MLPQADSADGFETLRGTRRKPSPQALPSASSDGAAAAGKGSSMKTPGAVNGGSTIACLESEYKVRQDRAPGRPASRAV